MKTTHRLGLKGLWLCCVDCREGKAVPANTLLTDIAGELVMYTVYASPLDYPGKWVVRKWVFVDHDRLLVSAEPLAVVDSLEAARAAIAEKMPCGYRINRHDDDEPQIWETWV